MNSDEDFYRDALCAAALATAGDAIALLRDLIATQREGEAAVQARLAATFRALGLQVETVTFRPSDVPLVSEFGAAGEERQAVVARLSAAGQGRSLLFFAHPDSEPLAGLETWRHDPFAGTVTDGRLHGWGVADDLAGVAAMAAAAMLLQRAGVRPLGEVIFASTPSKRHARGVTALLHRGLAADAAIYLHPAESGAGLAEVKAFTSGQIEFLVTVRGRAPDTSEPLQTAFAHLAVDPLSKVLVVIEALRRLDRERAQRIRHPLLHEAVGRSTNLMISHIAAGDPGVLARAATRCVFGGALSFPTPESLEAVRREIENAVQAAAAGDDWLADHPPEVVFPSGTSAAEISADSTLFEAVAGAVSAVTGQTPLINPMHTGSDIRNPIVQKGIPTLGLGPLCGDLTQNGAHDEWVDVAQHLQAAEAAAGIVARWCGVTAREDLGRSGRMDSYSPDR
jgi:acetylornithine deacetylase